MISRKTVLLAATIGVAAVGVAGAGWLRPALLWNTTASAPVGFYWLRSDRAPREGDLVAVRPPTALAHWLAGAGFLPLGVPLVKRVAAKPPRVVCRAAGQVTIDGRPAAVARVSDHLGRPLPVWSGCRRLSGDELFLLNDAPASLDGRYFGPSSARMVIGRLEPVWTTETHQ